MAKAITGNFNNWDDEEAGHSREIKSRVMAGIQMLSLSVFGVFHGV